MLSATSNKLRAAKDTNVYFSALTHPLGVPAKVWKKAIERRYVLLTSPPNRAGLFWFTISPLFGDRVPAKSGTSAQPRSLHLEKPAIVLDPIWALPDHSLHALRDAENSPR
jgi:hypothetical protein